MLQLSTVSAKCQENNATVFLGGEDRATVQTDLSALPTPSGSTVFDFNAIPEGVESDKLPRCNPQIAPASILLSESCTVKSLSDVIRLPGFKAKKHDCGRMWAVVCEGMKTKKCDKKEFRKKNCGSLDCECCYPTVCRNEALDSAERLRQAARLHSICYSLRHIVFSFCSDFSANANVEAEFLRLRSGLRSALLRYAAGGLGGTLIFHAYRLTTRGKQFYGAFRKRGGQLRKWDWLHTQTDWRFLVEWSPHFHFVGWVYLPKSSEFYADTGIVYKAIGGKFPAESERLVKTLRYQLSHRALFESVRSVTWLGLAAYNRLGCRTTKKVLPELCPCCGEKRYSLPYAYVEKCGEEYNLLPFCWDVAEPINVVVVDRYWYVPIRKKLKSVAMVTAEAG